MASRKIQFAQAIMECCTSMAQAADNGVNAKDIFFDRGYNSGGAHEIVDSDIEALEITAAQLISGITLIENLDKFLTNQVPVQGDYDATLNQLRTDL